MGGGGDRESGRERKTEKQRQRHTQTDRYRQKEGTRSAQTDIYRLIDRNTTTNLYPYVLHAAVHCRLCHVSRKS